MRMILKSLIRVSFLRPLEVQFRGNDDDREAVEQEEVVDDAEKFPEVDDERRLCHISFIITFDVCLCSRLDDVLSLCLLCPADE